MPAPALVMPPLEMCLRNPKGAVAGGRGNGAGVLPRTAAAKVKSVRGARTAAGKGELPSIVIAFELVMAMAWPLVLSDRRAGVDLGRCWWYQCGGAVDVHRAVFEFEGLPAPRKLRRRG